MSLSNEIAVIAEEVGNYKHSVVKSRNRHREVTSKLSSISQRLLELSKKVEDLQKIGEVNSSILEEIHGLFANGHLSVREGETESRRGYADTLVRSIPGCVTAFSNCVEGHAGKTTSHEMV